MCRVRLAGARGPSIALFIDLGFIRDVAANLPLSMAARGGSRWEIAYWDVPGGIIRPLLVSAKAGYPPRRWFSLVDPASAGGPPRYRWSTRALRWGGRFAGVALPAPAHVSVNDPEPVARWMAEVLSTPGIPRSSSRTRAPRCDWPRRRGSRGSIFGGPGC